MILVDTSVIADILTKIQYGSGGRAYNSNDGPMPGRFVMTQLFSPNLR
jgi:hypothetical protein